MKKRASRDEPELLKLLNSRAAWNLPEYKVPSHDPRVVDAAIRAYSAAHSTDPFAAARMRLYLARGYELPSEVLADSNRVLAARQARKAKDAQTLVAEAKREAA